MVATVFTGVVISTIVAWWKEKIGGTMLIISAIALGLLIFLTAHHNQIKVILILAGPILLSGILYFLSLPKNQKNKS